MTICPEVRNVARIPVRPVVDAGLWKWAKKTAVDLDRDASDLVELGLRLVKAVLELGYLPDNCAELAKIDEEALGELASLARLAKSLAEEPSFEVA